jgi:hypothetical protein
MRSEEEDEAERIKTWFAKLKSSTTKKLYYQPGTFDAELRYT